MKFAKSPTNIQGSNKVSHIPRLTMAQHTTFVGKKRVPGLPPSFETSTSRTFFLSFGETVWSAKKAFRRRSQVKFIHVRVTKQDKSSVIWRYETQVWSNSIYPCLCFSMCIWAWPKECFHSRVNDKTQFTLRPHNQRFKTNHYHGTTYLLSHYHVWCFHFNHARCNHTPSNLFKAYFGTSDDTSRGMKSFSSKCLFRFDARWFNQSNINQNRFGHSVGVHLCRDKNSYTVHNTMAPLSGFDQITFKTWSLGKL